VPGMRSDPRSGLKRGKKYSCRRETDISWLVKMNRRNCGDGLLEDR
jgi:hypothetical protein